MRNILPEKILKELGCVRWSQTADAFIVQTKLGATLQLAPNSDMELKFGIHIDEISVPEHLQRRGIATEALKDLCRLADEFQFELKGGPVGWSENPRSGEFVEWLLRFHFEQDPAPNLPKIDDATAFYVRRAPRKIF